MKNRLHILLMCIFFGFSSIAFATHIVGGSLTYFYNGGSSYTITLKLYRDCSSGTASFPNTVTINVEGYNGASFSPSKDIDIDLGAVSTLPPTLDPCAIPPNPMPCVQEGIYTITVNNLPPNPGGYHLTYQVIARNLGLSNVNSTCNCIGSSFYAYIPGTSGIWNEDFTLANNTTVDNGSTAWSIAAGTPAPSAARVNNNLFEITGANFAQETWTSQSINITSCPSVNLSVNLSENGTLDGNDTIFVYYRLNGGALTPFSTNGFIKDDYTNAVSTVSGLAGSTVQIVVRIHYDGNSPNSEIYRFDNVIVSCNDFVPNSNPVFTLFPPIFICVGEPFTFDHSATDADGDSLVYSFYTPYNGDNAIGGALDPTFSGNIANFSPVVWKAGYSEINPLGGAPLNLNSSTGLLTGTASLLGQFVVGVMVKEYRNGKYMGETLRDFQFNVVNCPQPPLPYAGPNIIVNQGCSNQISANGFDPTTVIWNSVYPGALGAYNNYLSCASGCLNTTATGQTGAPPFVDYQICGLSSECNHAPACDTVRVTFNFTLGVSIIPQNPTICVGQTSTTLTANGSGGTPPYSYLWNNVNPSQSILVGNGVYTVKISDGSGCPPAYATVTVTSYSVAISASAGADQTVCVQIPVATLNASVTGASGGIWSGGSGIFSPNNTTLTANYTPSPAELAAGFANIILTTTGNGSCPPAFDTVKINYVGFSGVVSISSTPVSCFAGNNGTATVSIAGGTPAYSYSWSTVPAQSTATATSLAIGTYTVTTTNGLGCTSTNSVSVSQPGPLALASLITNVSCNGGGNGSISITPSGGVAPYTYLWSNGATTSLISSLTAQTYTITVFDANACQITSPYSVTQPLPIAIILTPTPVNCYNGSDGIVNSTVTGGTTPYSYSWSSGATSPNASGLQAGTYTLSITDNLACLSNNSIAITQPSQFLASTTSINESCSELNNGSATAICSGGSPGYTYLWQPGATTTITINNLSSGIYTLTATDLNGCQSTAFATISEPALLALNFISQVNVSCFAGNDGSVTASPSGGTLNYSYIWSNGATTSQISSLTAQTYTVTVTDINGCNTTNSVMITQPTILTAGTTTINESCSYLNNGSATAAPSGGTAGYTYLWHPVEQTTSSISNLASGTYSLTVTDSKGCIINTTASITEPPPLVISFTAQTNVSCFAGSDGSVTASPTGGISTYSYLWNTGATTAQITTLTAQTYTVTVTDNSGCSATNAVIITQPPVLSASTSKTNETCDYLNNGIATAIPSGGTPTYNYVWSNGLTTSQISNLASQSYTVTVTDSKGCSATAIATITQPSPLLINFTNQINVSCFSGNNGSVAATPSGGTANYSYLWSNGSTASQISNLTSQIYTLTVTDNAGCVTTNSVVITQPAIVAAGLTSTDETCNYMNDGTATASASGGSPGYTYLWQPGLQTTGFINNLSALTYTLTVTDLNGCTATANAIINQPPPLAISFTGQTNVSCFAGNDGSVTASPSGGTPSYSYLWSNGATTSQISNLTSQIYTLTVTDISGCIATNSVSITQPDILSASTSKTNETCDYKNNGTATAIPSGGTPTYSYLWSNGSTTSQISNLASQTYTVTVTDSKGCSTTAIAIITQPSPLLINFTTQINVSCFAGNNGFVAATPSGGTANYSYLWSTGATTSQISNLSAQTYTLTVTDNAGCDTIKSVVITQPTIVVAGSTSTDETCNYMNDGTATASASGGSPGYTYLWQPGLQTTGFINNLSSLTYTLTVTDLNGCTATANAIINQPPPLAISFTGQTNVSCFAGSDGAVTASPSGGTPTYSYLWSNGATTSQITNLLSQTYTVTITDMSGCMATKSVIITQPTVLLASTSKTNEICNYLNNGTATAIPAGGTPGYSYLWSTGATTSQIINLSSQTYTVTVTDAKGCSTTAIAAITEPAPLSVNFTTPINVACFSGNNGSVSANPSGGTPNYSYLWSNGTTTAQISNLTAQTYTLTITDNAGCDTTNSVVITQPALLTVSATSLPASCYGGNDGSVAFSETGGTAPFTFTLMPGSLTGQNIPNLAAGSYSVSVTDSKGCIATNSIIVTEPSQIILVTSSINSDCGNPNGQTSVSVTGGNPTYSYLWSPTGGTAATAVGLYSGLYNVVVTDSYGCTASQFGNVNENSAPVVSIFGVTNVNCYGGATGTAQVSTSGGIGPFTYSWQPSGGTDALATGLTAGTYTVTVIGSNGCQSLATTSPAITQRPPIFISVSTSPATCFDVHDGSATAIASGGTPGFTYQWLPSGTTGTSITGLRANTYTIQVLDLYNCIQTVPFTITEPIVLSDSFSITSVNCFEGEDGAVSAFVFGGNSLYNYSWMPGNYNGQNISNLSAGTYTVTISDSKECSLVDFITITQPTIVMLTTDSVNSNCSLPNGQASVVASGGTGSYLYQWSPTGGNDSLAIGLLSGAYTISVTDSNGCISTSGITVNDNASPVAIVSSITNVSCDADSNGTATVSVLGGAAPYAFSWIPSGSTDSIATGLLPGIYTVTVTDANSCQSIPVASPEITQPYPIYITVTKTNVSCFGGNDGTAIAIGSGGTPGYTYQWQPGGTTGASITNLSATIDTIVVTDANYCVQTMPFTITQPPAALSVSSISSTPVSCFGGADGSVSAAATGGTPPYNYYWMPGNSSGPILSNLSIGTYTVTINDSKGCTIIASVIVTQPPVILLTTGSINSNCSLANGQAYVTASGGMDSYLYQWSPSGGNDSLAIGLLADTYTVEVTDTNGCIATKGVTVNDNASPVAIVFSITNVSCNGGSDGTATVTVIGGAEPYTYSWLPSGVTDSIATGLLPGTYTVTVTDGNTCQSIPAVSPEITQPYPISIGLTKTNVSCYGGSDGTASAIAYGGTPGYTYQWQPGGTTGSGITNLSAAIDTIIVTDANFCVETMSFAITQPPAALSVSSISSTPVSCFGGADGSVSAAATGGTPPYNYYWMPGNNSGPTLSNLSIGTYTVTINDSKGCTIIASVIVTQPPVILLTTGSINSNCSLANGQAYVTASGGMDSYLYQWFPSGGNDSLAIGLLAGTYTVEVTDTNGCIATKGVTVNDNASPVAIVFSITNVSCNGGSDGTATLTVIGGAEPYTYLWLPSGVTDSIATGLLPGTYTVTVTDGNTCQSIPAVSPEITQPYPISIGLTKTNVSCYGGSNGTASAIAYGGTPGYTYQWQPGGITGVSINNLSSIITYTIEVTDANNCLQTDSFTVTEPSQLTSVISSATNVTCLGLANGTATVTASGGTPVYNYYWLPYGGNGTTGTGLAAGSYTVTITDFNACTTQSTVIITEPGQVLSATSTGSATSCFGGSNGTAGINATGGTPSYSYQWIPAVSTSDTASGLSPGNYTIIVKDNNSCQTNVSVNISEPSAITGSLAFVNPSCGLSNGAVSSQLSGGALPYSYLWSVGGGTTSGLNNLFPGNYSVQIADALNCSFTLSANLINIPSPVLNFSSVNNVSCKDGNNGSATINITQGTIPYTINWTPSGGNNFTATVLSAGTYTVNVIDAIGCQATDSVVISEPTPVDVSISSINNVLCFGGNTGSISVAPFGGTGPLYTYSWAPNSSVSSTATNLSIGTYTVNVMDQNNCIKAISATITQPALLSSSIDSVLNPTCFGGVGTASVMAVGGVLPYSYSWSASAAGETGSTAYNLSAGTYTVTVTDTNGCVSNSTVLITQPQQIVTIPGVNDTLCLGQSGSITASAIGGGGSYIYVWQPSGENNQGSLSITPTSNTTYTVVAYDQNGCPGTPASISAVVYTLSGANVQAFATSPICPGENSAIYVETSGTTGPLTYQWNNNLGTGPGVYLDDPSQPTTYIVTVHNVCGLFVSDSVEVLINELPTLALSSDPSELCALGSVQFIDSSVTGNVNDPITSWYWNFGDGTSSSDQNPYHSFDQAGSYYVTLTITTDGGCTTNNATAPLLVTAYPAPVAAFSFNSADLLIPFDVLVCLNQSAGADTYSWSFGEGGTSTEENPVYTYSISGVFQVQLIATSQYGCTDTAYSEVTTNANIIFPTAFTPNLNGSQGGSYTLFDLNNNVFFPYTYGVIDYKLEMFNRWGEEIFESLDIKTGWDGYYRGQLCQQDAYVWKAYIKLNNGKVYNLAGVLTLLR